MTNTKTVAGIAYLQYSPQVTLYPSFSATDTPTTLAEAPIGVPLPPMSVPSANAQAIESKSSPVESAIFLMTGTIVAAKGILSTIALQIAESHNTIKRIAVKLPPLIFFDIRSYDF